MHLLQLTRRLLLGGLTLVAGETLTAIPTAAQPPAKDAVKEPTVQPAKVRVGKSGELLVPLGGFVEFAPKLPNGTTVTKTAVANEQYLRVEPDLTNPDALRLTGLNSGVTRLTFYLNTGKTLEYEVVVQTDYDLLRKVIAAAVPTASVNVLPGVGNGIILTGYVNKPGDAEIIAKIAAQAAGGSAGAAGGAGGAPNIVNAIQVGGPQHVMIEVVVAQVSRSELRSRGADFLVNGNSASFSSLISGFVSTQQTNFNGIVNGQISADPNLRFGLVSSQIFAALRALKAEGLSKILSEPKVTTQSGRPAVILSGGQQAVLSATGGGFGSISVQLERVGTQLQVLPIVYGDGKIYLEVSPSIRAVDAGRGIQTPFGFSPGFSEQQVQATVVMESGQTFAIGGLLETTVQATNGKLPVLGELPFVGSAFSTARHEEREVELVVLVTPRLVDAMDCSQVPRRVPGRETRSVDDYEFFLEGLLEAPRGQRQVWNGKCYNAAYKCDPTYGTFPAKGNVCGSGACNATNVLTAPANCLPTNLPTTIVATPGRPALSAQPAVIPVNATENVPVNVPTIAVPNVELSPIQQPPVTEGSPLPTLDPITPGTPVVSPPVVVPSVPQGSETITSAPMVPTPAAPMVEQAAPVALPTIPPAQPLPPLGAETEKK